MAQRNEFRILAGVEGSRQSRAAVATLVQVPWPDGVRVRAVVARQTRDAHRRSILLSAIDRNPDDVAERARRELADRWPDAEAVVVDKPPIEGILSAAREFRADVIVVGWRGYGVGRRLLMGTVSRGVVRGAACAVLVVRGQPPGPFRHIVLAFDGSANASRAVELLARFRPPREGRVTIVGAVELLAPTSRGPSVAGIRSSIARGVKRVNAQRSEAAMRGLNRAAQQLRRSGWRTRTVLKTGEPLREVLDTVNASRASLLVLGARGTSGVRHLLLGSVAEGALNRSPVPVLLAR
jgi:nucleotide-binding universal stress UspA family protein